MQVFLSPLFFPSSVMMTVATAGEPAVTKGSHGECIRLPGERMPMLFLIPRMSPTPGAPSEYAMLGLGDVVVPGLLLTYACRMDLASIFSSKGVSSQAGASCDRRGRVPSLSSYMPLGHRMVSRGGEAEPRIR